MSEQKDSLPESNQDKLRRILQNTALDIWGSVPQPAATDTPSTTEKKKPSVTSGVKIPSLADIWKTADETVEWTEALGHEYPADGLTTDRLWQFYRTHAAKVLKGDLQSYVDVLTVTNPLGDLTPFAADLKIRTPDADTLEASFECCPEYLKKEPGKYLGGLALRIARDLFAVLPVEKVRVEGFKNGKTVIRVLYERDKLRKINFKFLDPVAFAGECGEIIG